MRYMDRYGHYLDGVPVDARRYGESGRLIAFGYTSDLDVLIDWDVGVFNGILARFLDDEPSAREGDVIASRRDFARIVSHYAMNGLGGEVEIVDESVCRFLEDEFETSPALGGTCAQGAAALGAMGFPLLAHITDRCAQVCRLMDYPGVSTLSGGRVVPIAEGVSGEPPVRHMILQFSKGDVIEVGNRRVEVPVSNRVILDFDKIHKIVPIDPGFTSYLEANAARIPSYSVSGFNAIVDRKVCDERTVELRGHFSRMKAANPSCSIYLEGAHYFSAEVEASLFRGLSDRIDVLGINEEELVSIAGGIGIGVDKDDLRSVLRGLDGVSGKYPVGGIVMHTKDYSMYYGKELRGVDIEKGLTLGNLMSATRARTGRYGSREDCAESLSLGLSEVGLSFADELESCSPGMFARIVPSRYMERPACTIGLGDTFMAGVQLSFI
jgi:ADP-dependent phosphofructokinase/glucokinase